jgi:hypothetical protein
MGWDHGTDRSPTWGADNDADKGRDSARRSPQETVTRTSGGANARSGESTGYQADHGMLAAPGAGGGRHSDNVFALYRNVGAFLLQSERLVGHADELSAVALHAGFDHFDSLANLQASQVGPRTLLLLSTERSGESQEQRENQARP